MRNLHSSVETVNAAATAIISAESRVQPSAVQKRSWGNCWSIYWCFGWNKQRKRISHSVLVSSEPVTGFVAPIVDNHTSTSTIFLPFIAPPSSPTSFLRSDPSSAPHSPTPFLSLKSLSLRAPSIDGTTLFTVGPYAHETQLVSPPVFSAFTTEPSTASFTPPPETTTPSSPEVPFAELLSSSLARSGKGWGGVNLKYEFKPCYHVEGPQNDGVFDHRVSFELLGEEIPICIVREGAAASDGNATENSEKSRTISFGSSKDFHFNNKEEEEEEAEKSGVECEWWTKDKSVGKQWSFFSMLQQSSAR